MSPCGSCHCSCCHGTSPCRLLMLMVLLLLLKMMLLLLLLLLLLLMVVLLMLLQETWLQLLSIWMAAVASLTGTIVSSTAACIHGGGAAVGFPSIFVCIRCTLVCRIIAGFLLLLLHGRMLHLAQDLWCQPNVRVQFYFMIKLMI